MTLKEVTAQHLLILGGLCDRLARIQKPRGYWNPSNPFSFVIDKCIYNLSRCWLSWCIARQLSLVPIPNVLLSFFAFHNIKETTTLLRNSILCLLFHIKWELCLLRSAPPINYMRPRIIQAGDTRWENISNKQTKSPLKASNLSAKVFYHTLTPMSLLGVAGGFIE